MEFRAGTHPEEANNTQRGTRRRSQTADVTGRTIPSNLSNHPIINGTQLHDYAFLGTLSGSSTFSISNPTNIYNSSEKGTPVGSSSGAPQPGNVHETQAATGMNTTASVDIPILSAQPQFQTQAVASSMNNIASSEIPMHSAQPQFQMQAAVPGMNTIPQVGFSHPMQMDRFDPHAIPIQHTSLTPAMQPVNASRRTTGDVNMSHGAF